ncbi:hypothetical protein PABG_02467 [Paracoccidioides brasiliensis Pb03]|nr:hypothetical protein PABG_02467 [Paracoccidioides brasiliensis Pb03]
MALSLESGAMADLAPTRSPPPIPSMSSITRVEAAEALNDDTAATSSVPLSPPPVPSPISPTTPISTNTPPSRPSSLQIESFNRAPKQTSITSTELPISPMRLIHRVESETRRDSSLATSRRDSRTTVATEELSSPSLKSPPSIPSIIIDEVHARPSSRLSERKWSPLKKRKSDPPPAVPPLPIAEPIPFRGISLDIPTGSFGDLTSESLESISEGPQKSVDRPGEASESRPKEVIDNEESIMSGGSNNNNNNNNSNININIINDNDNNDNDNTLDSKSTTPKSLNSRRIRSNNSLRPRPSSSAARALSTDEEILSQRVRLMYEKGDEAIDEAEVNELLGLNNEEAILDGPSPEDENTDVCETKRANTPATSVVGHSSRRSSFIPREPHELAGGLEDWENIQVGDVDRYGFIIPRKETGNSPDMRSPMRRVSASLLFASSAPRKKRTLQRAPSAAASSRSFAGRSPPRKSADQSRPSSSQSSYHPGLHRSSSKIRYATNKLPHNRNRKFVDEARDMLTLPGQTVDDDDDGPLALARKKKEWEREDKWRKMAKVVSKSHDGSGMTFEFDVKSSKLTERTWKGIPDRWRATAWYAFLSASAKKRKDSPSDTELIQKFNDLQEEGSPDDVQIDIDVPRTINSHIMFRRRYRGGQRLLFRVLHAMSLYFPDTGYVQGMAALAATLLAYYDEEHAFVMLVRLWQLRGLDRLYRSGFSGLMEALDNFEKGWLDGGEVAQKLTELGIPPTAYGTRWYLTLFNYSIPFPAQLRVWDVFMLLGDSEEPPAPTDLPTSLPPTSSLTPNGNISDAQSSPKQPIARPFGKSLDVLHAASAALIDGMRDIILESDFENAMKVLTSWVPINDVEIFMRVARAEYKVHRKKS